MAPLTPAGDGMVRPREAPGELQTGGHDTEQATAPGRQRIAAGTGRDGVERGECVKSARLGDWEPKASPAGAHERAGCNPTAPRFRECRARDASPTRRRAVTTEGRDGAEVAGAEGLQGLATGAQIRCRGVTPPGLGAWHQRPANTRAGVAYSDRLRCHTGAVCRQVRD